MAADTSDTCAHTSHRECDKGKTERESGVYAASLHVFVADLGPRKDLLPCLARSVGRCRAGFLIFRVLAHGACHAKGSQVQA